MIYIGTGALAADSPGLTGLTLAAGTILKRVRLLSCLLSGLLTSGCHGYYPSWHYLPDQEIHSFTAEGAGDAPPRARIGVRVVGILRPEHELPRRLHVRFDVENPGDQPICFKTDRTGVTPSGQGALLAEGPVSDLVVEPKQQRSAEVFFLLPDERGLPDSALADLEIAWTVEWNGSDHLGRSNFKRGSSYDGFGSGPGYGGAWYGGGPWYGPYWYDDPWYWHRRPWWRLHSGLIITHCD